VFHAGVLRALNRVLVLLHAAAAFVASEEQHRVRVSEDLPQGAQIAEGDPCGAHTEGGEFGEGRGVAAGGDELRSGVD
jgi:hypothetical protein